MGAREVVDAFCRRHRNEDVHTQQVARLALIVFDRVVGRAGLRAADRGLLEAAARLHDVGFAAAPQEHVEAGVQLVLAEGLRGFSRRRLEQVAAVMLLHGGDWRAALAHPVMARVADRERLLRLGAILRVADSFDRGHVQHARIASMRLTSRSLHIALESPGYPGLLQHAVAKTDLWEAVMPLAIRLRLVDEESAGRADALVLQEAESTVEALARRILLLQYRLIRENQAGALAGGDPEPLHDIRVALRRFRSALKLFRKPLRETSAEALSLRCRDMNRALGVVRDTQVWAEAMAAEDLQAAVSAGAGEVWEVYRQRQQAEADRQQTALVAILTSEAYRVLLRDMASLLRTELPDVIRRVEASPARPYLARRLEGIFERILGLSYLKDEGHPEQMHALRRLCRQERYWSEFAAPCFGGTIGARLALRLKAVADALGSLHDSHVAIGRLQADPQAPAGLRDAFVRREKAALADFEIAWGRLYRHAFVRRVSSHLARAVRG